MKFLPLAVCTILASAALAQCPLGRTPETACPESDPACALYVDADGDGLCDNPGPQPESTPPEESSTEADSTTVTADDAEEPAEEESAPQDSVEVALPAPERSAPETEADNPDLPEESDTDQAPALTEETPDPVTHQFGVPEDAAAAEQEADSLYSDAEGTVVSSCPLGRAPLQACPEESPLCALYVDADGDLLCDNPGPQPADSTSAAEDSLGAEGQSLPGATCCPLGRAPEEACPEESPLCALYQDVDGNLLCDNPFSGISQEVCSIFVATPNTCPLYLNAQSACPDSMALCPHWYGVGPGVSCANPTGGKRRDMIVLMALAVLLPLSTIISRHYACRGRKCTKERDRAHVVMHAISLIILGFVVQGCYCPLGTFQYLFLPGGLAFLGWMGLAILLLPVVFALFWGRVFCGWVCPMGALQEILSRIHVPGKPRLPVKLDKLLHYLKYLVLAGLVALLTLLAHGSFYEGHWPALFCSIDPFHTIFTFFLVGSLWLAGLTVLLSILLGRFFCKYLCFYGALLSLLSRLRLWRLITGPSKVAADAEEEMETEEREVEEAP